ncbi:MAG: class III extradiol ring-cleavage dioxygenase [Pseudomonas sp.]
MLPSLFISHGSPMLALQPGASGVALSQLAADLPKPTAILLVSAHWESSGLRVGGAQQPATLHDFGGFPAPLYQIQYPAPGSPALADQVIELLAKAGLVAQIDPTRPLDHGAWVPLSLLYPQADIPVVQLSLPSRLGPALQNRIGHCLSALRRQGVLLIGSGSITHNLGELNWQAGPHTITPWAKDFRDWIVEHLEHGDEAALLDYRRQAPHAQRNHPSDEHLLPLFFARAAGERFSLVHQGFTYGALGMDIYRFD